MLGCCALGPCWSDRTVTDQTEGDHNSVTTVKFIGGFLGELGVGEFAGVPVVSGAGGGGGSGALATSLGGLCVCASPNGWVASGVEGGEQSSSPATWLEVLGEHTHNNRAGEGGQQYSSGLGRIQCSRSRRQVELPGQERRQKSGRSRSQAGVRFRGLAGRLHELALQMVRQRGTEDQGYKCRGDCGENAVPLAGP